MAIDPVFSVSFEALRAVTLADATRDGRILEAKVTAMLSDTLARLSIAGQDIDVTTPQRLPVGAQLTLRAEREGGQLRLITQAPIQMPADAPSATTAAAAQQAPDILIEPGKSLMAQVQAIAVEAMLGDGAADEAGLPPAAARTQPQTPEAAPSLRQPLPEAASSSRPPADVQARSALADTGRPQPLPSLETLLASRSAEEAAPSSRSLPPRGEAALFATLFPEMPEKVAVGIDRLASMLAIESLLSEPPADDAASVQNAPRAAPAPREANAPPIPGQQPPETQGKPAPDAGVLASTIAAAADRSQPEARRDATMEAIRAYISAENLPSQPQASRQAAFHIDIPLYFPGNPEPLRLQVTRDDEDTEEGEGGTARPRSWTIRFAAEAGSLGMIHAAISMADGRIGVQLWAEKGDTAAAFREDVARLQDALEASNLALDALKIQQGAPPGEGRGVERDAGR